ncbi:microfibril-associated glycoprotein 4-like [Gigantopelta aegis]|uniref:microfibril-associated glycoprotein 4-like n=1 Tax=Gigantopelta aegis TaxID=1735272 RepID=UPI001B88D65E|nr:microfibril-associated glycoprotein 4-like [Gigantopelta aegis]
MHILGPCEVSYIRFDSKSSRSFDSIRFDVKDSIVCLNGGYEVNGTCTCVDGFVGSTCERLMTDCSEGFTYGYVDGIYNIQPPYITTSFPALCAMKYGGRTLMQYRHLPSEDFYRNWTDYRDGFGSLDSDFWLGLEKVYQIVRDRTFDLRLYMRLKNGTYYQHRFLNFTISDEASGYTLYFDSAAPYSVDPLGDSLTTLKGSKFSTKDVDNDNWSNGSCADLFESGFWFNSCADCNPNGRLLKPSDGKRTGAKSEVFWTNDLGNDVPYRTRMWLVRQ